MNTDLPTREDHGRVVIDSARLDTVTLILNVDGAEKCRVTLSPGDLDGEPLSYVKGNTYASALVREMVSGRLEYTLKPEPKTGGP